MTEEFVMRPVAYVRGGRSEPIDDHWQGVEATLVLENGCPSESLAGLAEFSHLDVVYVFHQVDPDSVETAARHPRSNPDWPLVGIFAQRARMRPNRIGVGTCRILAVGDRTVTVADLDALDGTPVLDLKPHMVEMGPCHPVHEPAWARELMEHYWR